MKDLSRVLEELPPGLATINWSGLLILNALQQVQFLRLIRGGIATSQRGQNENEKRLHLLSTVSILIMKSDVK